MSINCSSVYSKATSNIDVPKTETDMVAEVLRCFLELNPNLSQESDEDIKSAFVNVMRDSFWTWNELWQFMRKDKDGNCIAINRSIGGVMYPSEIPEFAVAELVAAKYRFVNVNVTNLSEVYKSSCTLGVYVEDGDMEGIYALDDDTKMSYYKRYRYDLTKKMADEIETHIKMSAPIVDRTGLKPGEWVLIPVKNGIFNWKTKELLPFSPEFVFTWKCRYNYNVNATNKQFIRDNGEPWDLDSWGIDLMSDVKEDWEAVLYTMAFTMLPSAPLNRIILWISDNFGNSGKGTLAKCLVRLIGSRNIMHMSLDETTEKFALERLPESMLILGLDNEFKAYLENTNVLKLLSTKEETNVERKHIVNISVKPMMNSLQLTNSWPKLGDHSESQLRRWYGIEFKKCFKGVEDVKIKEEYLQDLEVMEYLLKSLLELPFRMDLPETENARNSMQKIIMTNNSLGDFVDDVIGEFPDHWDKYPLRALYLLYTRWHTVSGNDMRNKLSNTNFYNDLSVILRDRGSEWSVSKETQITWSNQGDRDMFKLRAGEHCEPIIAKYATDDFIYSSIKNNDLKFANVPVSTMDKTTGFVKYKCAHGCIVKKSKIVGSV